MKLDIPGFNDFWWEESSPEIRKKIILNQLLQVTIFAKENVPFYKTHYRKLNMPDINKISSLEEFVFTIPHITKDHLSYNNPKIFIPENIDQMLEIDHNRGKYWKFGTGGSTSKPIQVWHSMEDWRGFALTANRHIEWDFYKDPVFSSRFSFDHDLIVNTELKCRNTPLNGSRIFGTYIGDHITNAIYARMLIGLGSEFEWRPSASSTLEDLYESTQNNKINGILAPPGGRRANKTKGSFLDNLLHYSAKDMNPSAWELSHRYNPNFNFIFWSSMPIDEQLLEYLENDLKIPYIKGHFGSTEICPTAATCSGYMRSFHLTNSNSLVLVVDYEKMQLAKPDQLGYTIVSKIGATNRIGESIVPTGMYFINYLTGDGAKLSNDGEICSCGRNTPILYDLQRLSFHEGKAIHGCQINLSDIN